MTASPFLVVANLHADKPPASSIAMNLRYHFIDHRLRVECIREKIRENIRLFYLTLESSATSPILFSFNSNVGSQNYFRLSPG